MGKLKTTGILFPFLVCAIVFMSGQEMCLVKDTRSNFQTAYSWFESNPSAPAPRFCYSCGWNAALYGAIAQLVEQLRREVRLGSLLQAVRSEL